MTVLMIRGGEQVNLEGESNDSKRVPSRESHRN